MLEHASEYLIHPKHIGPHLSIDESCLNNSETNTVLTNEEGHGGPDNLVTVMHVTKAESAIVVFEKISTHKHLQV